MSLQKDAFHEFEVVCDECGEEFRTGEEDFRAALDKAKANGFKSKKDQNGEWINLCENCN